jgi:histidinol-phosphate aminotransferase
MNFEFEISKSIADLNPYTPGKPISEVQREFGLTKVVKLASNENPLGPSPKALQAIQARLSDLHRYPDPTCHDLIELLSKKWKVPVGTLGVGNGSNELIDLLIRILCQSGDKILLPQYSFIAYQICAQAARLGVEFTPVDREFKVDLVKMADQVLKDSTIRLVFLPNPNNPTGRHLNALAVRDFLEKVRPRKNLVIVFDEAYTEFVRASDYESAIDYLSHNPQVVCVRTLSKVYGLAGLRVGVMVAHPQIIDWFHRVRNPFNVNDLAQAAACAALLDQDFIKKSQQLVWSGLEYFYRELKGMQIPYVESQANFLMFDSKRDAAKVNEELLKKGIILRPVLNYGLGTHLRISVGLPEENELAISALKQVLPEFDEIK